MFEIFKVPSLCIQDRAVLALLSQGHTSGIVIKSGDKTTRVVPVKDRRVQLENVKEIPIGGSHITDYLCRKLKERGYRFKDEEFTASDIKEKLCYIAANFDEELAKGDQCPSASDSNTPDGVYELPDGQKITVGCERFTCPEVYFQPSLIGHEHLSVHQLVHDAVVNGCTSDDVKTIRRVFLSGGSTMFRGFAERLTFELKKTLPDDIQFKVTPLPDGKYSSWCGGSVLATLPEFTDMLTTKAEYDELGPSAILAKD